MKFWTPVAGLLGNKVIVALAAIAVFAPGCWAQEYVPIGSLVDFTGRTSVVGRAYGQGKVDAANWINENGGIYGKLLDFDTVDDSYVAQRSVAAYRKWKHRGVVAVQGWGNADTEAMLEFVGDDQIPYFSASYSAHLTDPLGTGPAAKKSSPFVFPMGPSYTDGARALLAWALADWRVKGQTEHPTYVHIGDRQPYSDAPRQAGESFAADTGFEVLPAISETQGEFEATCRNLKKLDADHAFLADPAGSNVSILHTCRALGVKTQFMANIWGFDENVMRAAGEAADGVVWVMGAAKWAEDVPGMETLRTVSRMSDPEGRRY